MKLADFKKALKFCGIGTFRFKNGYLEVNNEENRGVRIAAPDCSDTPYYLFDDKTISYIWAGKEIRASDGEFLIDGMKVFNHFEPTEYHKPHPRFEIKRTYVAIRNLKQLKDAMSADKARFYLNGIFFKGDKAVATDGLIMVEQKLNSTFEEEFIAPSEALCFFNNKQELEVAQKDKMVYLRTNEVTLFCQKVEGIYPEYERIIPQGGNREYISPDDLKTLKTIAKKNVFGKYSRIKQNERGDTYFTDEYEEIISDKYSLGFSLPFKKISFTRKLLLSALDGIEYFVFGGGNNDPVLMVGKDKKIVLIPARV